MKEYRIECSASIFFSVKAETEEEAKNKAERFRDLHYEGFRIQGQKDEAKVRAYFYNYVRLSIVDEEDISRI